MTEIIGRGERAAAHILKKKYPNYDVWQQVQITKMLKDYVNIDPRILKTTIDLVMIWEPNRWEKIGDKFLYADRIAVHIDDRHHTGPVTAKVDRNIDSLLKENGVQSLRIREEMCPNLFKERMDETSEMEIESEIMAWGIKL